MIRHSLSSSFCVKRRDTISSGFMRNRISSCTRPEPSTPPPIKLAAKSTFTQTCEQYNSSYDWNRSLIIVVLGQSSPVTSLYLHSRCCRLWWRAVYSVSLCSCKTGLKSTKGLRSNHSRTHQSVLMTLVTFSPMKYSHSFTIIWFTHFCSPQDEAL